MGGRRPDHAAENSIAASAACHSADGYSANRSVWTVRARVALQPAGGGLRRGDLGGTGVALDS